MNSTADLGPRLSAVASYVLPGLPMADVGTDHGLLPASLILAETVPWAIAGDVAEKPLRAARRCDDRLRHRLGDGLDVLADDEVATVVIAGMGPDTMQGILDRGRQHWGRIKRFVLQPNHGLGQLRGVLQQWGWALEGECLVEDAGHIYGVMAWAPIGPPAMNWTDLDLAFGPMLLARRDPVLRTLLVREADRLRLALARAQTAGDDARSDALKSELALIRRAQTVWASD